MVYLVGLHIYYKMIHGPYNVKVKTRNIGKEGHFTDHGEDARIN